MKLNIGLYMQKFLTTEGYKKLNHQDIEVLKANGLYPFITDDEFLVLKSQSNMFFVIFFNKNSISLFNDLLKIQYNAFLFSIAPIEQIDSNSSLVIYEGFNFFKDKHLHSKFLVSFLVRNLETGAIHYLKPFQILFKCSINENCSYNQNFSKCDDTCDLDEACKKYSSICNYNSVCKNKVVANDINGVCDFSNYLKNKFYSSEEEIKC
ncbi:MAG: hypothetical protein KA277_12110 [Fusobacteriaceae bacterium]|nr:hypothetical protein [Fusobacteriaceae bacterium]